MRVVLQLDPDEADRLIDRAVVERRSVSRQAEWLLRTALGLPIDQAPTVGTVGQKLCEGAKPVRVATDG